MNETKSAFVIMTTLAAVLAMMIPTNSMVIAQTTEDDGEFIPNDATEEEKEQIEDTGQREWEDAGKPGDTSNNDDDDNDDGPNPYCDQVGPNYRGDCHDRKDYSDITGLYTCNDGTHKTDWRDCKDATATDNDNNNPEIIVETEIVSVPVNDTNTTTTTTSCEKAGILDGKIPLFDAEEECKLQTVNDPYAWDNTYYDGFMEECIKHVGQTEHTCVKAVKDAV